MAPYTLYAGGYEDRIVVLSFDPSQQNADDRLVVTSEIKHGRAPTWLTFSEDGSKLYTTSEWGEPEGVLDVLHVDEGDLRGAGAATSVFTGGLWACHTGLITSTTPPLLVTTNYKGASLGIVPLAADGSFGVASSLPVRPGRALGPVAVRQEQAHPHGAHPDARGRVVVVPDLGTDDLRLFRVVHGARARDALEEYDAVHLEAGDGPRHVLFSPMTQRDGGEEARMYVLNELSNSVSVFRVDYPPSSTSPASSADNAAPLPTFTLLQSRVSLLPPTPLPHQSSFSTWHAAELVLTPDGRTLLASNRAEGHDPLHGTCDGAEDLLAVFALDDDGRLEPGSGTLTGCGGRAPRHMSLSSESVRLRGKGDQAVEEGRYLAVACHDSDEVVVFERVGEAGRELEEVARRRDVGRPGVVLWK
ncbi:hypothetical protein JCM10449v2_003085 [Rhodotorula kratochvilovae]